MKEKASEQDFTDKVEFITKHKNEIKPVVKDATAVDEIIEEKSRQSPEQIDQVLEEFENKLFICEKSEYQPDAKRILLTVDNPGAYNTIKGIVSALQKDERCKSIAVITGGVSNKTFATEFGNDFKLVRDGDKLFLDDLNQVSSENNPFDITIASASSENGPESVALWSGKSLLGANKTFLVVGEWAGLGSNFDNRIKQSDLGKEAISQIDGIFCNDSLAKRIIIQYLPDFPQEKIFDIGTPALDSLELPEAKELRRLGRENFDLKDGDFSVLYLGDCGSYPEYGCKPELDIDTFKQSLEAIINLAQENPNLKLAFLFRPHPMDPDKDKKYEFAKQIKLPSNLKFVSAAREVATINEATFSADLEISIVSTENIFAPIRGNSSVFLGFKEEGMGGQMIEGFYKPNILTSIKQTKGIYIADSPENLASIISDLNKNPSKHPEPKVLSGQFSSQVLDKIFE